MEGVKKYNVIIVGHVSNGKTTLVEALTGKSTKRTERERKEGKTIKLGYANCFIMVCLECKNYFSEKDTRTDCPRCFSDSNVKVLEHVSFIDSPGHHEYIHTMTRGSVNVDHAILLTDCRADKLREQTMEHLVILTIYGISSISVVQNKVDLVSDKQAIKHKDMLTKSFINTVADGAPIIPISAHKKINLDILLYVLHESLQKLPRIKDEPNCLKVLRSFDINKNGTDIVNNDIHGGVIGVAITGTKSYNIGDKICIAPGIIYSNGENKRLYTSIESIFMEDKKVDFPAGRGGVYALGTKLDPCLTKSDRLIGQIAGFEQDLPQETKTIIAKVTDNLRFKISTGIKSKQLYRLIIGNIVCNAETRLISEKAGKKRARYEFVLNRPICTVEKRFLIYTFEASCSMLIGFGEMEDAKPVKKNKAKIEIDYEKLYANTIKKMQRPEINPRYEFPIPDIYRANLDCIWVNFSVFCGDISREEKEVAKFIKDEYALSCTFCQDGLRISRFRSDSGKIDKIMKSFVRKFVQCRQCLSVKTTKTECLNCGASLRLSII